MFDFLWSKKKEGKAKILVVDDEPNIAQTLQDRLELRGFTVVTAQNGKEGLEAVEREKPDLILLDVIMPVMDGHEMLEEMRRINLCPEASVIILTARSQTQDIARAAACGINEYVIKPFDISELFGKIENVLEKRQLVKQA